MKQYGTSYEEYQNELKIINSFDEKFCGKYEMPSQYKGSIEEWNNLHPEIQEYIINGGADISLDPVDIFVGGLTGVFIGLEKFVGKNCILKITETGKVFIKGAMDEIIDIDLIKSMPKILRWIRKKGSKIIQKIDYLGEKLLPTHGRTDIGIDMPIPKNDVEVRMMSEGDKSKIDDHLKLGKEEIERIKDEIMTSDVMEQRLKIRQQILDKYGTLESRDAQKALDRMNIALYKKLEKVGINIERIKKCETIFYNIINPREKQKIDELIKMKTPQSRELVKKLLGISSEKNFKTEVQKIMMELQANKFIKLKNEKLFNSASEVQRKLLVIYNNL